MNCLLCEDCLHFDASRKNRYEQGRCKRFSAWKYASEPHCPDIAMNKEHADLRELLGGVLGETD